MRRDDNFRPWWLPRKPELTRRRAIFTAIGTAVTIGLGNLGLSLGVAMAVGSAATSLAIGAALLGLSIAFSPRVGTATTKTPQAQAVINQSIGPRVRGYGRVLLGGTRAFFDSKDRYLHQVIMMHSGEIDAIESIRVGDRTVTLDDDGNVTTSAFTYKYDDNTKYAIRIRTHLGTEDQLVDAGLQGAFPSVWTFAHRLRGIAYLVVRFRSPPQGDFQKIFPEGYNTPVRGLCRLSKVYDPRTGNTTWSDNAGLCILDYLTHPDGFKKSRSDCDLDSFRAFADLCDEAVPLKAGGTEKRYRLWGVYQLTDEPEDVLRKMRATCDAELYQNAEGKIAIRGGKWEPPTVTITDRDILGHTIEEGNNRFAAFNELKITYTSPQHDYQSIEATPWIDVADQDERGPIPSELDLDFVPSPSQARRLAKIHIAKSNPRWKGRIRTNLTGLDALGERTIRVILPELAIDDAFYVAGFSIDSELKSVEIEKLTISEAAYSWNAATEEGDNPALPEDTAPDLTYPIPEGLALIALDDHTIQATVTPADEDDLTLQVQVRAGAGSDWEEMVTRTNNYQARYNADPGTYDVRARWTGAQDVTGDWTFPYATITLP